MTRNISAQGIEYLIAREGGMKLTVYDDGFGYPTVGVGHLVVDKDELQLDDVISKQRAQEFLQDDLLEAREAVEKHTPIALQQHQFDALVIFCFNVGVGAYRRSTLVKRLMAANMNTIVEEELPRWNRAGGREVRGLTNRRIDTVEMFVKGDYTVNWVPKT